VGAPVISVCNTQAYLDSHRSVLAAAETVHASRTAQVRTAALMADLNRSLERLAKMAVK